MDNGPKSIYDFKTLNGEIGVEASQKAIKFCEEFEKYATTNK